MTNPSLEIKKILHDDDDDWLDVTSKEELLQKEVSMLSIQLDSHTKELKLLKQKLKDLMNEKDKLQNEFLYLQNVEYKQMKDTLKETLLLKQSLEERYEYIVGTTLVKTNQELSNIRDDKLRLECMMKDMKCKHEKEMNILNYTIDHTLKQTIEKLEMKVNKSESEKETLKKQLEESHSLEKELQLHITTLSRDLLQKKKEITTLTGKLEMTTKHLGSVAILAEERKDERHSLIRTMSKKDHVFHCTLRTHMEKNESEMTNLKTELSKLKMDEENRCEQLSNTIHELEMELKESRKENMKNNETIQNKSEDLVAARVQILELEAQLKESKKEAVELKEELIKSRDNEESLEEDMQTMKEDFDEEKEKYEERLANIREALGIKKKGSGGGSQQEAKLIDLTFGLPIKLGF